MNNTTFSPDFLNTLRNYYGYHKSTIAIVDNMMLLDDVFFRIICSDKNVCQEIIRTITGNSKLTVISAIPQYTVTSLHREIVLDVLCLLDDNSYINIEVQKYKVDDDIRRCRFHLSSITANKTQKNSKFANIPNVTVIYISDFDILFNNQVVTTISTYTKSGKIAQSIDDGANIYIANVSINDNSDTAELLQLFKRTDAFYSSKFPCISNAVQYYKLNPKGREKVSKIIDDFLLEWTDVIEDILREKLTIEITNQVTEEVTDKVTEEVTNKVTEEVTNKVTEEVTNKVTEEVTNKVTEEVTNKVTEEVTNKVTEEVTNKVTEEVTNRVTYETIIMSNKEFYKLSNNKSLIITLLSNQLNIPVSEAQLVFKEQIDIS